MISNLHALDSKIKDSINQLEKIYERLCIPMTSQSFVEVFAEFSREIAGNSLFESYIKSIAKEENSYRQETKIVAVLNQASTKPDEQQSLNQNKLTRREQISEYLSLWTILRFNELYDIELHELVRNQLKSQNNERDLIDFNEGVIIISSILDGKIDVNLSSTYLPLAHRVLSGITQFFDKQQLISYQDHSSPVKKESKISLLKAEDLFFDKSSAKIKYKGQTLVDLSHEDDELVNFAAAFFQDGKLSPAKLKLADILKKINSIPEPLIFTKETEVVAFCKTSSNQDYNHVRYLKDKLNKLTENTIGEFIILKKKFSPNPNLFEN